MESSASFVMQLGYVFNEYIVQSTVHFPVYMVFSRLDYPAAHNWIAFN